MEIHLLLLFEKHLIFSAVWRPSREATPGPHSKIENRKFKIENRTPSEAQEPASEIPFTLSHFSHLSTAFPGSPRALLTWPITGYPYLNPQLTPCVIPGKLPLGVETGDPYLNPQFFYYTPTCLSVLPEVLSTRRCFNVERIVEIGKWLNTLIHPNGFSYFTLGLKSKIRILVFYFVGSIVGAGKVASVNFQSKTYF